jgi:hypothetical protein
METVVIIMEDGNMDSQCSAKETTPPGVVFFLVKAW